MRTSGNRKQQFRAFRADMVHPQIALPPIGAANSGPKPEQVPPPDRYCQSLPAMKDAIQSKIWTIVLRLGPAPERIGQRAGMLHLPHNFCPGA